MNVEPRTYVAIQYTLKLDSGEQVDSTDGQEPLGFIQGAGQVIEGMDKAVLGRALGDKFAVSIPPEQAYGPHSDNMNRDIPRDNFPEGVELKPGMGFTAQGPHGPISFKIVSADETNVVADFNHPLAGETLHFDIEVVEVREPRAEELAALTGDLGGGCAPDDCGSCGGSCG